MARKRSAKELGTRHDLQYFKRWSYGRLLRAVLAVGIPALAMSWFLLNNLVFGQALSAGPLSRPHAFLAKDCAACHQARVPGIAFSGFKKRAEDRACLACHDAPPHQNGLISAGTCSSCHIEHRGATLLSRVDSRKCADCHGALDSSQFASHITNFNSDHVEFAAVKTGARNPTTITFDHVAHFKPLEGPDGASVQLDCSDCHRVASDASLPWRFASPRYRLNANISSNRSTMLPPTYAAACATCHDLRFDPEVRQEAPHDKPEVVEAFLHETYKNGKMQTAGPPSIGRLLPRKPAGADTFGLPRAERVLWGRTCKLCHQLSFERGQQVPNVAPSNITQVWFSHARFDHGAHTGIDCIACHSAVVASRSSSDMLLPGIKVCRTCHNGSADSGHVENGCSECHWYHDRSQRSLLKPQYKLRSSLR